MDQGKKLFGFCPQCGKESVLEIMPLNLEKELLKPTIYFYNTDVCDDPEICDSITASSKSEYRNRIELLNKCRLFQKQATCSFDNTHIMNFIFHINIFQDAEKYNIEFSKIGQNPSYTQLNKYKFKNYSKLLKEMDCYDDYVKGINLFSHDIGIGPFVYVSCITL